MRCAGQAVIQFASDSRTDQRWAIKFFLSRRAFEAEAALYHDPGSPLGPFLPLVRNVLSGERGARRLADAAGRPLPPCIVVERGESLDKWRARDANGSVDVFTALQVCNDHAT